MGVKSTEITSKGTSFNSTITSDATADRSLTLPDADGELLVENSLVSIEGVVHIALTSDTDDLDFVGRETCRAVFIDLGGSDVDLTGIVAPAAGVNQEIRVFNVDNSKKIKVKNQNSGSSANNRFIQDGDFDINKKSERTYFYDHDENRWRPIGKK